MRRKGQSVCQREGNGARGRRGGGREAQKRRLSINEIFHVKQELP